MPVINTIELEGVSETSWGDAAREALFVTPSTKLTDVAADPSPE